jgi:hypothetical protein
MPPRHQVLDRARRIFRTADLAAEAVRDLDPPRRNGRTGHPGAAASPFESRGPAEALPEPASPIERAVAEERAQTLADGVQAMKKLEQGKDDQVTTRERHGLEAIVLLAGRPAILIQDGDFMEPPALWGDLKTARESIKSVIRRVGRINVSGDPNLDWLGTGFLAGPSVVLTNRHVAMEFAKNDAPDAWTFRAPLGASLDFKAELGSADTLVFRLTEIIGIHETYDLAALRIEKMSGTVPLPDPLPVAPAPPPGKRLVGRKVYVIGYPAWDGRRNDPEPMRRIFSDVYNVKRLQPGEISGEALRSFEILHDCSTLGGNSGSPVVDLETHRVIGLHFGGRYLENNHAIPLWAIQTDPLIQRAGLNFQ